MQKNVEKKPKMRYTVLITESASRASCGFFVYFCEKKGETCVFRQPKGVK